MECNRDEFAELIGRSTGWISKMLDFGMPAIRSRRKGSPVRINTAEAIPWLLEQAKAEAKPAAESQRERLAREQADKVALENAASRGELVRSADVEALVLETIAQLGSVLDGVPGRLANELAGLADPAEIRARLMQELRGARSAFADRLAQLADAGEQLAESGDDREAAAASDAGGMGGRESGASAREC